jgi:large subunit ribosomal protein L10
MNRDQKTAVVDEIADQIQASEAIFAVDYRGISVAQAADLRTKLREADARLRVVKNSLSERAADKAGMETLKPMLIGPTALAFVQGDAALAAKALNDAARQFNLLEFKGGLLNGAVLSADDVRSIARLPSRDVLYAQLVGTVAAPLTGLVRGLNALITGIAIQLQAMVDQGLVAVAPAEPLEVVAPAEPEEVASQPPADPEPEAVAPAEPLEVVAPAEPLEVAAQPPADPEPEAVAPAEPLEVAAQPPAEAEAAGEPEESQKSETQAAPDAATSDE